MHHRPRISSSFGQDYYFADLCSVSAIPRSAGVPSGFCKTTPVSKHYIRYQALWVPSPFLPPKSHKMFLLRSWQLLMMRIHLQPDWRKSKLVKDKSRSAKLSSSWAAFSFSLAPCAAIERYHATLLLTSKKTTIRRTIKAIKKILSVGCNLPRDEWE